MNKILLFLKNNLFVIAMAFLPPILIWIFLQSEKTSLEICIERPTAVVVVENQAAFAKDIEVKYRNRPVSSLYSVDVKIENTGRTCLVAEDFIIPIKITFNSVIPSAPEIIYSKPETINPDFSVQNGKTIVVRTSLLNPGDKFSFRSLLIDNDGKDISPRVEARIKKVKQLDVINKSVSDQRWKEYGKVFSILLSILGALVSATALFVTAWRFRSRVTMSVPSIRINRASSKLEEKQEIADHSKAIADKLRISNHDYKSNLLIIRIKIESLLLDIARMFSLDVNGHQSISSLIRLLEKNGCISNQISSAIRDILPVANRELHSTESYLSEEEFQSIQHLGLNVIASLEMGPTYFTGGSPCQMSGQKCSSCNKGIMDVSTDQESVMCNNCGLSIPAIYPRADNGSDKQKDNE